MKRPRPTVRARMTLVYSGMFLLAGLVLLGLTYWLVSRRLPAVLTGVEQTTGGGDPPAVQETEVISDTWQDALSALITQGLIALAVTAGIALALGWLVTGRMLRPLQRVTDTAARVAAAPAADPRLHERIPIAGPRDELRELSETFNRMLERIDGSFDGQRRFVANASHELRTPLTLTRALLETAVHRQGASEETRQLGATLLEINAKHERLIDGLLLLTRSERELAERTYVDLADVVERVAATVSGVEITVQAGEAPTLGDGVLLERLVENLVENAVRYNLAEGGWVRVASRTSGDLAVVEVANSGPVVLPHEVEALFEPFRRLGSERLASPGSGLGLSIVRTVARAHGGEVRAVPRPAGGLTVTVTLPSAGHEATPGDGLERRKAAPGLPGV